MPGDEATGLGEPWDALLARVRPSSEEARAAHEDATAFLEAVQEAVDDHPLVSEAGIEVDVRIEGSLAKGTWLRGQGNVDLDAFVRLPDDPEVFKGVATTLVRDVGRALLDDYREVYAQHPYAQGTFRGHEADLVPCVRITDPSKPHTAVDRSPHHTDHVNAHLDDRGRDAVRALKAWLKSLGLYGADLAHDGFSGYLLECMVLALDTPDAVLDHILEADRLHRQGRRLRPLIPPGGAEPTKRFPEPLIVVDPVDPGRNVAAAVTEHTLHRTAAAAAALLHGPKAPHVLPPVADLGDRDPSNILAARATEVIVLHGPRPSKKVDEVLHGMLAKAGRKLAAEAKRRGVTTHAAVHHIDEDHLALLFEVSPPALPPGSFHTGPPAHAEPHADRYRDRWQGADDALSDVEVRDGRLLVVRRQKQRTALAVFEAARRQLQPLQVLDGDDGDLQAWSDVGPVARPWLRPALAALLDRRRPWQRSPASTGRPR